MRADRADGSHAVHTVSQKIDVCSSNCTYKLTQAIYGIECCLKLHVSKVHITKS
jgi:hypothetical protein